MNLKEKQKNIYVFINSRETMFVEGQSSQQFSMSLNERELKEFLKSSCPLNLKCGIIDGLVRTVSVEG